MLAANRQGGRPVNRKTMLQFCSNGTPGQGVQWLVIGSFYGVKLIIAAVFPKISISPSAIEEQIRRLKQMTKMTLDCSQGQ